MGKCPGMYIPFYMKKKIIAITLYLLLCLYMVWASGLRLHMQHPLWIGIILLYLLVIGLRLIIILKANKTDLLFTYNYWNDYLNKPEINSRAYSGKLMFIFFPFLLLMMKVFMFKNN